MIKKLIKKYGSTVILDNIDFNFFGKCALVGLNGVGKTTLLKVLIGLDKDYEGDVNKLTDASVIFSENILPDYVTIYELVRSQKLSVQHLDLYLSLFDVDNYKNKLIKNLSLGTSKKMNIIYGLLVTRKYILLDEPTNGLDYKSRYNLVKILKEDKRQILLISHDFNFIEQVCENIAILNNQKIIENTSIEGLLKKYNKSGLEEVFNTLVENDEQY